jgi:hypothetical protein
MGAYMEKKLDKRNQTLEAELNHSYSIIKNDLLKLKKDIRNAYLSARNQAKKQIQNKLDKTARS